MSKTAPAKTPKKAAKPAAPKASAKKAPSSKKAVSDAFAVIATGGKQYLVSEGQSVRIEKMKGEYKEGDKVTFDEVLLVHNGATSVGVPHVKGAKVAGTIAKIGRAKKVVVVKYKQKSRYFKKNGHRQPYFQITIDSIR